MGALFSKKNGVWLMVSGGKKEPYNEALALVGKGKAGSLDEVLGNSEYCTALAGNAEAVAIMKDNYSADMTTAIDSAWNDGLNLLNFTCGLDFYLYYPGNQCTAVSGGWEYKTSGSVHTQDGAPTYDLTNEDYMHIRAKSGGNYSGYGYSPLTFYLYNKTARNYKALGYSKIEANCKNEQGTASFNIGGTFSAGTVTAGASSSYISGNGSTSIAIASGNMAETVHEGTLSWALGADSDALVSFRCTPKYQNGAFGNWGDLYVYSVKVYKAIEPMVLYDAGTISTDFTELCFDGGGSAITYNSDHIYIASNPNTGNLLQPYAAIVTPIIDGGGKYKYVNISYESWTQSATTSQSQFAVINDTTIEQGSNHRSFTNKVVDKMTSDASGTVKLAWTDGKRIGIGCFSQSNRSCTMKVTKIWLSEN